MLCIMDKGKIIGMCESKMSHRESARRTGHDRGKIAEVWREYCRLKEKLGGENADI